MLCFGAAPAAQHHRKRCQVTGSVWFHLCISPAPRSRRALPSSSRSGTLALTQPRALPWGRARTGTAWHGWRGTGWAALPQLGTPQRDQQGLQPSQDPEQLIWKCGAHPCSYIKQCLSLLPCEGNPALHEPLGCCRGVRACLSPTHLCALTPFFTSPSKGCVTSVPVLASNQPVTKRLYFSMSYRRLFET